MVSKRSAPMDRGHFQLQIFAFSFGWPKHIVGKRSERVQAAWRRQNVANAIKTF
jgi:hypothetical protein